MARPVVCGIYSISCIANGTIYLGSSNDIGRRWNKHRSDLCRDRHGNAHLQAAWNKYGAESFEFAVLIECAEGELLDTEQYALDCHRKHGKVFNQGECVECPARGAVRSPETRAKIAAAQIGRPFTDEMRAKLSWAGRKHSEETKAKISAANKGRIPGAKAHAAVAASNRRRAGKPRAKNRRVAE